MSTTIDSAINGKRSRRLAAGLALALVLVVGCGRDSAVTGSPVTEEQVTEIAENALAAFNSGDYTAWSRDWSGTMKTAIDEDAFKAFRDQFHAALGDYQEITAVTGRGLRFWHLSLDVRRRVRECPLSSVVRIQGGFATGRRCELRGSFSLKPI